MNLKHTQIEFVLVSRQLIYKISASLYWLCVLWYLRFLVAYIHTNWFIYVIILLSELFLMYIIVKMTLKYKCKHSFIYLSLTDVYVIFWDVTLVKYNWQPSKTHHRCSLCNLESKCKSLQKSLMEKMITLHHVKTRTSSGTTLRLFYFFLIENNC